MHARGVESVWGMWVSMRTYALGVRVLVHVHGVSVCDMFISLRVYVCVCVVWCLCMSMFVCLAV